MFLLLSCSWFTPNRVSNLLTCTPPSPARARPPSLIFARRCLCRPSLAVLPPRTTDCRRQAAALNAVVADASTHVIRGTTVSVQWSRGAKDAGGDRPRRRNSATSVTSSNNGCSPSRGSNRSSPKMNMFSHKNGGHRGSGGGGSGGGGGGGGGSCGSGCNHGFSPMRSRSQGHIHASSGAGGGVPYSFCNGGRHGSDHHNQQMVRGSSRDVVPGIMHHDMLTGGSTAEL